MTRAPRVLFYCHNVFGLGHIVRTLRIAAACVNERQLACAVITGCRSLDELPLPEQVEIERLPPVRRDPRGVLSIDPADFALLAERGRRIVAFARAWQPDVFVADTNPLGLGGELVELLTAMHHEQWPTRAVWGVPYATHIEPPRNPRVKTALSMYDTTLAYSDGGENATGFVVEHLTLTAPATPPLITGVCGGGTESERMATLFVEALRRMPHVQGRFIAGPLATDSLRDVIRSEPRIELRATASLDEAVRDASVVVSRAGYNSTYALAATTLPLILAPLPIDGSDQHARVERLRALDGVWTIDERAPSALNDLTEALEAALQRGRASRALPFRVDGASRAAERIGELAVSAPRRSRAPA